MNNVYHKLPARMDDGRAYSIWDPAAVINEKIIKQENITTNREYREFLQQNAIHLMKLNQVTAQQNVGITLPYTEPVPTMQSQLKDTYTAMSKSVGNLFSF